MTTGTGQRAVTMGGEWRGEERLPGLHRYELPVAAATNHHKFMLEADTYSLWNPDV